MVILNTTHLFKWTVSLEKEKAANTLQVYPSDNF
jgi:hypothetical protein